MIYVLSVDGVYYKEKKHFIDLYSNTLTVSESIIIDESTLHFVMFCYIGFILTIKHLQFLLNKHR